MAVILEFKFIVLFFLYITNNARSTSTDSEKEGLNSPSEKVSHAQDHTGLHWPKGIVSYYLDNLTYDDYIAQRIRIAMNTLESASCVRFKSIPTKPVGNITWIHFTNPQGERNCVHEPKLKNNSEIILVLGFDCLKEHEILHTLLHAVGFKDEVSHPQRDQYVRVMWNNIQPEYRYLYHTRSKDEGTTQLLIEYDPLSIMHFHDRAFSMNGQATIMPLVPGLLISPSDDLSQLDKMKLRLLFDHECNKRKVGDMIDTCKMLLSDNTSPDDSNIEKGKPDIEDKIDEVDNIKKVDDVDKVNDADKVDKVDENDKVDEDDTGDKASKGDQDDKAHKGDQGDNVNEVDIVNQSNDIQVEDVSDIDDLKSQNRTESQLNEKQPESDERSPKTVLNREIPVKLFYLNNKKNIGESTSVSEEGSENEEANNAEE